MNFCKIALHFIDGANYLRILSLYFWNQLLNLELCFQFQLSRSKIDWVMPILVYFAFWGPCACSLTPLNKSVKRHFLPIQFTFLPSFIMIGHMVGPRELLDLRYIFQLWTPKIRSRGHLNSKIYFPPFCFSFVFCACAKSAILKISKGTLPHLYLPTYKIWTF